MRVTSLLWQKAKKNHEPVDEGETESGKAGLKLNIQKTKIMAFGLITSWQMEGAKVEVVTDFIFLGSKTIADSDCSHGIKRLLLLGRKAMTNIDSIWLSLIFPRKQRHYFTNKGL